MASTVADWLTASNLSLRSQKGRSFGPALVRSRSVLCHRRWSSSAPDPFICWLVPCCVHSPACLSCLTVPRSIVRSRQFGIDCGSRGLSRRREDSWIATQRIQTNTVCVYRCASSTFEPPCTTVSSSCCPHQKSLSESAAARRWTPRRGITTTTVRVRAPAAYRQPVIVAVVVPPRRRTTI